MTERTAISKRVRFEVFKRDEFTCQYCGIIPPEAVLHVDHIDPVANGGGNDIDNLVTSCDSCNLGKGARLLTNIPDSLASKAAQIAESEAQLAGYREVMDRKQGRIEFDAWQVSEILEPGCSERGFDRRDLMSIKRFVEKLGVHRCMEAAEKAYSRGYFGKRRFKYFCAICWNWIREQGSEG